MEQENKFIYTTGGKLLRGFLCLLAFGLGLALGIYTVYGISNYGSAEIFSSDSNFFKSTAYQDDVDMGMHLALDFLEMKKEDAPATVSLIDVSQKELYTYDLAKLYDNFGDELYMDSNDFSIFNEYRKDYKHINNFDITDYAQARKVLADKTYADDYIYFDSAAFRALFYDSGFRNTNYRFSYEFSEDSYFLFDYQGKNKAATKLLEKIKETDKEESVGERYDLENIDYAVYDNGDTYYSTEDDYFGEMGSYVYSVSEVNDILNELDEDGTRYDSILMGLLKAENQAEYWIQDSYYIYGNSESAEKTLKDNFDLNTTGMFYYLNNNGVVDCSDKELLNSLSADGNASDQQIIDYLTENNCIYYSYTVNGAKDVTVESNNDTPLQNEDAVEYDLKNVNEDGCTQFIYGIYIGSKTMENNTVQISMNEYNFYKRYAKLFLSGTIVMLLLTIGLAVSLIRTTGRRFPKDTEVLLNSYDKLPGEVWWIITISVWMVTGLALVGAAEFIISNIYTRSRFFICICIATGCAVFFAFFVMEFVLSFCRRIKGKQFVRNTLCARLFLYIKKQYREHKGETFKNVKGTNRLIIIFVIYAVLNLLLSFMFYDFQSGICFVLLLLLQIAGLIGIMFLSRDTKRLIGGVAEIVKGNLDYKVKTDEKFGIYKELTNNINHIGDGLKTAIETSLKDERMKTELITNVSHDLKTPLTSIINYINLLKGEEMVTEEARHYVEVLDKKALRLKQLTEDLVEAAKANSGNLELDMMKINLNELMSQAIGEFEEKFEKKGLIIVANYPEETMHIMADGRRLYRVLENVFQNVCNYAMPKTRVYADLTSQNGKVVFTVKNVSEAPLNISPDELMERFTRGDESRTTEGSGLGLSIARDLTNLQGGTFDIVLDGDLFKVIITFPLVS